MNWDNRGKRFQLESRKATKRFGVLERLLLSALALIGRSRGSASLAAGASLSTSEEALPWEPIRPGPLTTPRPKRFVPTERLFITATPARWPIKTQRFDRPVRPEGERFVLGSHKKRKRFNQKSRRP